MMDAEKMAMQRRIDTLDEYAVKLHAALTEYERENARLKAELETVKRERDAAVREIPRECNTCKNFESCEKDEGCRFCSPTVDEECPCCDCIHARNWEWSGLCAENGGAE